jgi:hypothetical protein
MLGYNRGHFILEAETVFHFYLVSHCRWVTETLHVALTSQVLQALQVWFKSVFSDGHLIREFFFFIHFSPLVAVDDLNADQFFTSYETNIMYFIIVCVCAYARTWFFFLEILVRQSLDSVMTLLLQVITIMTGK